MYLNCTIYLDTIYRLPDVLFNWCLFLSSMSWCLFFSFMSSNSTQVANATCPDPVQWQINFP